jgi:mannosyltransferase OCH1-like enzyme
MPPLAKDCIASWHEFMPDYEYRLWNEDNFDVTSLPYTLEAYEAGKYAFVSDYVRLWALYKEGGVYMDVDFEVFKPYDDLLHWDAFAGLEGSKHLPLMMGVVASSPNGIWVKEQLDAYEGRHFINPDGTFDMTTNVKFISDRMRQNGFVQNGKEQQYKDLHVFPVDYFCPRQTTGEYLKSENTYCEHRGLESWSHSGEGWKSWLGKRIGQKNMTRLIKIKRKLFG